MRYRHLVLSLVAFVLFLAASDAATARSARVESGADVTAAPAAAQLNCSVPGESYGSLSFNGRPTDRPPAVHADLNLGRRGAVQTGDYRGLVDYSGGADSRAPQLATMFLDNRTPAFASTWKVYDWDWSRDRRGALLTRWPVTTLGMSTGLGEVIRTPSSGYDLGSGYEVLVLYATDKRITLKYTREDNVVRGYTVHLENVCVEPRLLALYNSLADRRQGRLPALRAGQAIGRAMGDQIAAAIRDSGTFMDPRSRKDWWIGRLKMTPDGWRLEKGD